MATVLQTQYLNYTGQATTVLAAGVWTDVAGLTLNITNSSVLSAVKIDGQLTGDRASINALYFRLTRNGTPIGNGVGPGVACYGRFWSICFFSPLLYVDTPASIALLTYQVQAMAPGGNTIYTNTDSLASFSGVSTLVLQELG